METYKLIKRYPSLPSWFNIGDKVVHTSLCPEGPGDDVYVPAKSSCRMILDATEVEDHPNFWKKVVEVDKDYEVLSIKDANTHRYGRVLKVKDFDLKTGAYLECHPESTRFNTAKDSIEYILHNFIIYQVERLSDGKVFTIGDEISTEIDGYCSIYGFSINANNEKLSIIHTHGHLLNKKYPRLQYGCHLSLIDHAQPLFTTEDGYFIFKGDDYWYVDREDYDLIYYEKAVKGASGKASGKCSNVYLYFKKKENAQQWIEENRPRYSKKYIEEAIKAYNKDIKIEKFAEYLSTGWRNV